jgi:hypothetical protein
MNVMLSYKSDDYEAVRRILARLADHGVKPWIDTEGIQPGSAWRDVLLEELRTCDVCVPVLSKAYVSSEHCRMEVLIARSLGRRIVPIMLEDCFSELRLYEETKGLEDILMVLLYTSKAVGLPIEEGEAFRRLVDGIQGDDHVPRNPKPVYISYSAEAELATNLARTLEGLGVWTWVATIDCRVGENWRDAQARGMLRACAHVVVLDDSVAKQAVLRTEMLLAEARAIPVFTVYSKSLVDAPNVRQTLIGSLERGHQTYRRLTDRRGFYLTDDVRALAEALATALKPLQSNRCGP